MEMEATDEENALLLRLHLIPQVEASEYTSDGSVDINKQPALKHSTGNWRACYPIFGIGFSEGMVFSAIATNLVTYLTTVLHESKVDAARNISSWSGVCFLAPLLGASVADIYLGRYWTMVVFLPVYIVAMLVLIASASLPVLFQSDVHPALVYLGLYLASIASGGMKPCISAFGADQFDVNDPVELVKKGSFFNWYFFLTTTSSLLSGTVIVWLQDNVGWAVSYVIPTVLMLICYPAFLAGSRVYRFREMGVSPLTSILQVVVAAVRKWHMKLPDDSSLLYEQASCSTCTTEASYKNKHTYQFFDKAAIVPPGNESTAAETSPCEAVHSDTSRGAKDAAVDAPNLGFVCDFLRCHIPDAVDDDRARHAHGQPRWLVCHPIGIHAHHRRAQLPPLGRRLRDHPSAIGAALHRKRERLLPVAAPRDRPSSVHCDDGACRVAGDEEAGDRGSQRPETPGGAGADEHPVAGPSFLCAWRSRGVWCHWHDRVLL